MIPDEQDKLMDELLAGPEAQTFRQASFQKGLAAIKRQRRQRKFKQALAIISPALLLVVGWWTFRPAHQTPLHATMAAMETQDAPPSKVRAINDDDLLKLFPNRPIAIIGGPGHRKLVFLDHPASITQ